MALPRPITAKHADDVVELVRSGRVEASVVVSLMRGAILANTAASLEVFLVADGDPVVIPRRMLEAVARDRAALAEALEPFVELDEEAAVEPTVVRLDADDPLADGPELSTLERVARGNARTLLRTAQQSAGQCSVIVDAERAAAARLQDLGLGQYDERTRTFTLEEATA